MKNKVKHTRLRISVRAAVIALCLLMAPSVIVAQKATPDTSRFLIGQQIKLTLELEVNRGDRVNWPSLNDTLTKSLEIISKGPVDTLTTPDNRIRLTQELIITSFDTGFQVIPPIPFGVSSSGNGKTTGLLSPAGLLEVLNVEVDMSGDIKDLKPVMKAPYTLRDFMPYLLLLLGLLLLGLLIWFYIRNHKQNKPLIKLPSKPQPPPHQIAMADLEELKREQLWQKGQVKEYHSRLTDILRTYFEARFGVDAREMTSDEIADAMKDHLSDMERMADLKTILSMADMAKFAKARPMGADNELSMTLAVSIVSSTIPAPVRKESPAAGSSGSENDSNENR